MYIDVDAPALSLRQLRKPNGELRVVQFELLARREAVAVVDGTPLSEALVDQRVVLLLRERTRPIQPSPAPARDRFDDEIRDRYRRGLSVRGSGGVSRGGALRIARRLPARGHEFTDL